MHAYIFILFTNVVFCKVSQMYYFSQAVNYESASKKYFQVLKLPFVKRLCINQNLQCTNFFKCFNFSLDVNTNSQVYFFKL